MHSRVLWLAAACALPLAFAPPVAAGPSFGPDPTLPLTRKLIGSIGASDLEIEAHSGYASGRDQVTFRARRPRVYSGEGPTVEGTLDLGDVPSECDAIGFRFAERSVVWPRDPYVGLEPEVRQPEPEPETEEVVEERPRPRPRPEIEYFPSGRTDTLFPLKGPIYCLTQPGGGPGGDLRTGYGRARMPTCSQDRAALERGLEESAQREERRSLARIERRRMEREEQERTRLTIQRCTVRLDVGPDPARDGHFRVRALRDGAVIAEASQPAPARLPDYEAVVLLPFGLAVDALNVAIFPLYGLLAIGAGS